MKIQMKASSGELIAEAIKAERNRIIKLLKDTAGETCGNSVHIVNGACLCDLVALIKKEDK
jgi:hypothetical protein